MSPSTSVTPMDHLESPAKAQWEDPAITLERSLDVQAQSGPPAGGPPSTGTNYGFIGPLGLSLGAGGVC